VRTNVALPLFTDFVNFADLKPGEHQAEALSTLFDEVIAWSTALCSHDPHHLTLRLVETLAGMGNHHHPVRAVHLVRGDRVLNER
jgi:hypothetical protein